MSKQYYLYVPNVLKQLVIRQTKIVTPKLTSSIFNTQAYFI